MSVKVNGHCHENKPHSKYVMDLHAVPITPYTTKAPAAKQGPKNQPTALIIAENPLNRLIIIAQNIAHLLQF